MRTWSLTDVPVQRTQLASSELATKLLQDVATGDVAAFEVLYRRFAPTCLGLARAILVDPHLAADVVQHSFLDVWQKAGKYDPARGSAAFWLLSIVHNKAVDCVRREQRRRRYHAPEDLLTGAQSTLPTPEDTTCLEEARADVRRALGTLPATQRQALLLAYFGGHTYAEVADRLGVPLSTVKSRCRAGMATLREILAERRPSRAG